MNAELDAGHAQDKASNAAVALKGLEQQLEGLRAEAAELRDGGCWCMQHVPVLARHGFVPLNCGSICLAAQWHAGAKGGLHEPGDRSCG